MNTSQLSGQIVFGTSFKVGPNYEIVSPIGQGAYGVVVAAKIKTEEDSQQQTSRIDVDGTEDGNLNDDSEMVAIKKIVL